MKAVFINKSDSLGGAAVVTQRLVEALRAHGVDARMLVADKTLDLPYIAQAAPSYITRLPFLAERLRIFLRNGMRRDTLFQIDTSTEGLPLHRHPWVKEADVVCLNWVNQGVLSLRGVRDIARLGKPIVWTMHDMWCFTGVCHHAGSCRKYIAGHAGNGECGECPLYGKRATPADPSHTTWKRKSRTYKEADIRFVAVSNWLHDLARQSRLLSDADVRVIPNAFPLDGTDENLERRRNAKREKNDNKNITIAMGAARLDDPVKGLPILVEALGILSREHPDMARRLRLHTFGSIRDASLLENLPVAWHHAGPLPAESIADVYLQSDIVVSSSLYETLPGTLIEGQHYGCVPVSFNRGGQPDIIDDGDTGILCHFDENPEQSARNLAEGILRAIPMSGADTRRRMRHSVEIKFGAGNVAESYMRLFAEISHG